MGRISKASLYRAYFHTIQDVEIRNSQDHDQSKAKIYKDLGAEIAQTPQLSSPSSAIQPVFSTLTLEIHGALENDWKSVVQSPALTLLFLASMPNRAP